MKRFLRAVFILIILFIAAFYLNNTYSPYARIGSILLLIGIINFIIALIRFIIYLIKGSGTKITPVAALPPKTKTAGNASLWVILAVLLIGVVAFFKTPVSIYSFRAFIFMDNFLNITRASSVINWAILGLFVGFIYGSFVAWKKYKLTFAINFISIATFIAVIAILFLVNNPSQSKAFAAVSKTESRYAYNLVSVSDKSMNSNLTKNNYASYLVDSNNNTAYLIKDQKRKDLYCEIEFSFSRGVNINGENVKCTGIMIQNGNRRSQEMWNNYGRVKNLSVWKNGTLITEGVAVDSSDNSQEIKIEPISVSPYDRLSVKLTSSYPGVKYPKEIAITELIPIIEYTKDYY
ncbi:MAG TPA: hypothetical protein VIJ92_15655 [Ginsengibacter sp.]